MGADPLVDAAKRINKISEPPEKGPTDDQAVVDSTEETSQDDTQSEEPKYTVKYNGEEIEVPLSELKLGYMREKDYRIKLHDVSDKSKALDAKIQSIDEKIKDAETLVEIDLDYLESEEGKQLRQDNPDEFLKRVDSAKSRADKLKKYREEKQARETEKRREKIKQEQELLKAKISDWLDEDIKTRETAKIVKYLEKQGYTQEEISNLDDHRVFVAARDAVKLEEILSKDLSAKEDKRPPKSTKPGSTESKAQKSQEQKLREKLGKSGNMHDAAAYFKETLFKRK